ncbi:hypothetical protein [Sutcliffiella rhizosphaerae]|uniref:Uncharacterized protein n=1 Tax=Sutcliffiella rhizosphaerae TaxID=2880967 RepID=A0ABM8YL65_9BACI|nr:hypothetical protein [Sutcliffiella rhizosphaerae]CAG9620593.1 hypothetical protein BACCIP111883_01362 [Sutcliffiella rhizosphaerae]
MDTRARRIVRNNKKSRFHYFIVLKDFLSSFILHMISLVIIAAFLIWVLDKV